MHTQSAPLLDGARSAAARDAVLAIAEDLSLKLKQPAPGEAFRDPLIALFFHYLHLGIPQGERFAELADQLIDRAVESLLVNPRSPALLGGVAGIAWLVAHVAKTEDAGGPEQGGDNDFDEVDDWLAGLLPTLRVELVGGIAGLGIYWLERLPHPRVAARLEQVVDALEAKAQSAGTGLAWLTDAASLPAWQRTLAPAGWYDIGSAHGICSVIAVLARIGGHGIAREKATRLADGAVRWLLAQRLDGPTGWLFPASVLPRPAQVHGVHSVRWCYGGFGVGLALLAAGRALQRSDWIAEAAGILRGAASDSDTLRHPNLDAALCHGAGGNAVLFNRAYQSTGEPVFRDAALRWFDRALELRRPGEGLGGYEVWGPPLEARAAGAPQPPPSRWYAEPGWLTGAAGIGLALLSGMTAREAAWDRLLAISG